MGQGRDSHLPANLPPAGASCLPADDFLEPEEYAEPPEAQPGAAADLGRPERGSRRTGEGGKGMARGHCSSQFPLSRSRGHVSIPELRGAGPKECGMSE